MDFDNSSFASSQNSSMFIIVLIISKKVDFSSKNPKRKLKHKMLKNFALYAILVVYENRLVGT